MPCPPSLVNYLVVETSDTDTFAVATTQVLPSSLTNCPVNGLPGATKYVRSKWRRNAAVVGPPAIAAEESDWSNTLILTFPRIQASDVESIPEDECEQPAVPIIKSVYGWREFLEAELLAGGNQEGVKAVYAGPLTSGAWPKGGLYVQNLSSDPTITIDSVDFLMGSNGPHAAGFTSLSFDHLDLDPLPLERGCIAAGTNITTLDLSDPGTPKRGVDYIQSFLGTAVSRWVHYVLIPSSEGDPFNLVCPQDSIDFAENVPPAYHCDGGAGGSYFGVRLELTQFSASARGVAVPTIEVAIYGRSGGAYSETLGRTFYDPFLPSHPFPGHNGSFYGNLAPASPPARIIVRFSTGLILNQAAYDVPNQGAGIVFLPTTGNPYQLDDFFVFVSDTTFSATLDAPSGDWWDMLGALPEGVYLARVARETNLFISNLFGSKLETGQAYHVRIGARRIIRLCQTTPSYLYSATLSEEQVQEIGATSGATDDGGTDTDSGAGNIVSGGTQQLQLIAGTGIVLQTNTTDGTLSVSLNTASIRESSGYLFVVPGTAVVGTNLCFEITADFEGVFKDWALRAKTAPTGASLIVDIHKNGTSIFANGALRPTLTAGTSAATGTVFDLPSFVKGDVFRMDIDQVGSSVPGERIEIQLNFDSPLRLI